MEDKHLFILVHNVENLSMDYFLNLVSFSFIHLVFSTDHIDASMSTIWLFLKYLDFHSILEAKLNLLKYNITNYEDYILETAQLLSNSSNKNTSIKGMKQILISLPPKEKKIYLIIMIHLSKSFFSVMKLKQLCEENDEILIEKEELERIMRNFLDHNIINEIEKDGKVEFGIPFSIDLCEELINFLEEI
jgi:hypothetical protein